MDFNYNPADDAFRAELRAWLGRNGQYSLPAQGPLGGEPEGGWDAILRWHRKLYEGGWLGLTWPPAYGGRGANFMREVIRDQELERAGTGVPFTGAGLWLLGPTLIHWGTEAQKRRHLRPILAGEEFWCQGYSEPNAGSDLASLQTRAVERGGCFIVNGSKIWTSLAHRAQWIFLLARTDPGAAKHHGITYLIASMNTPGITISPLVQMTGASDFNQVFFEDVRIPLANVVGQKNHGWQVAMTTLMFERSGGDERIMAARVGELARLAARLAYQGRPASHDARVRQQIGQFAIEAAALRYTAFRQLTRQLKGLPPGPEASLIKVGASELGLRIAAFAMELLGPFAPLEHSDPLAYDYGQWAHRMLEARGPMIYSGTNEIQRNILGERLLGLPRP